MKTKPVVGQALYSLNVGNAAHRQEQKLTPVIVRSVGRKYFKVSPVHMPMCETAFNLADWSEHTNHCRNYVLYESEQQWIDEKESDDLCREIWSAFQYGRNLNKVPLETLRRIKAEITP